MMPVTLVMSSGMASYFTYKKMSRPGDPENAGGAHPPVTPTGGTVGGKLWETRFGAVGEINLHRVDDDRPFYSEGNGFA